ncbi:hypothetical protein Moror_746 [Moniliophthora roreri MCA 2997]|uniref:Uncharacterized protein n=2 Tax=Moniliophthora roreri TaxID=221103 RepID=V2X876_MONRO|nr:hypothetical protein Moror_746 [Moniliophthora roreri MCA 2997]KAI3614464.1 hypothetical protein WG66_009655 [Moniliophthora roreri]
MAPTALSLQNGRGNYSYNSSTSSPEDLAPSLKVDSDSITSMRDFEAGSQELVFETPTSEIFDAAYSSPAVEHKFEQEIRNLGLNTLDLEAFGVKTGRLREIQRSDSFLDMDVGDWGEAEETTLDPDMLDLADALIMARPKSWSLEIEFVGLDNEAELQLTPEREVAFWWRSMGASAEDLGSEDHRPTN